MRSSPGARESLSVGVVVVNWNGLAHLGGCLRSLAGQTRAPDEVVVVDNGSTDGSAEMVERDFPDVRLVRAGMNLGFAAGCNLGARETRGELIAMLNPDTRADPAWLEALASAATRNPDVGMFASLMLFLDRPATINSAGIAIDVVGIAWDRLGGYPAVEGETEEEVFGPCGGAALYRREVWEALGGFDEDFFMYLEDVDFAWRAQARGWRCLYVPGARVFHAHSASAVEGSAFKNYLKARNKVWLLAKNYPGREAWSVWPVIAAYDLMAALVGSAAGRSLAPLRGRLAALRTLGRALAKRRSTSGADTAGWKRVRAHLSGVESPLAVWRRFAHL